MKTTRLLPCLAALTALCAAPTASAGLVTWGLPTNINPAGGADSDLDVSTNGTLVGAFQPYDLNRPTTTVNGVRFEAFAEPNGGSVLSIGNFTLASPGHPLFSFSTHGSSAPFSGLSSPYQFLLDSALSVPTGATMTLTMEGLFEGQSYEFQWWSNNAFPVDITTATAGGNSVGLSSNTTPDNFGGLGQFTIGTFIADATGSQAITFTPSVSGKPLLNGFQLRNVTAPVVPEPGTALFGLALLGTTLLRRRR